KYEYPLQWIAPEQIKNWMSSRRFHAGIFDAQSGHLHPLKYCLGLAAAARAAGVKIFENSAVYAIERGINPVVKTAQGELSCRILVLAANVYISEYGKIAPELAKNIMPVGTYMIATEAMDKDRADALLHRRQAVSDNNFVLDYFR